MDDPIRCSPPFLKLFVLIKQSSGQNKHFVHVGQSYHEKRKNGRIFVTVFWQIMESPREKRRKTMQQFMCIGRVGSDVRFYDNGSVPFASVSIADNQYYKDKDTGERKQITTWIPVVGYRSKAEFMRDYIKKGSLLCVSGTWKNTSYEKDGETRYQTVLRLDKVQFCDSKAQEQGADEDGFIPVNPNEPFGMDFSMPSYIPGLDE